MTDMILTYRFIVGMLLLGASLIFEPLLLNAQETIKGRLVANHVGRVSSEITGERAIRVKDLLVREGDRVKKGDVLVRLSVEQLIADRAVSATCHNFPRKLAATMRMRALQRASLYVCPALNVTSTPTSVV